MAFCTNCGAKLVPGNRFCTSCGAPVPGQSAVAQPAPGQAAAQVEPAAVSSPRHAASQPVGTMPAHAAQQPAAVWQPSAATGQPVTSAPRVVEEPYSAPAQQMPAAAVSDPSAAAPARAAHSAHAANAAHAASAAAPTLTLVRAATSERFPLECPAIVGKGSMATCRIPGNTAISRQHIKIDCADGDFLVEDLGSTNKTKLNGEEIKPGMQYTLLSGDSLTLANETFTVTIQ